MYIFFVLKHIYVHVSGPHNIFNVYFLPLKILPLEFPINESLLNVFFFFFLGGFTEVCAFPGNMSLLHISRAWPDCLDRAPLVSCIYEKIGT